MKTKNDDIRYVIFMNMSGLHRTVYRCLRRKKVDGLVLHDKVHSHEEWYDKSGNISCRPDKKFDVKYGVVTIAYKDETVAKEVLKALKLYQEHLVRRI
jgi:hypothetical protein